MSKTIFSFIIILFLLLFSGVILAQEKNKSMKWLRTGIIYGYASQNQFFTQDPDYRYENNSIKWSNHFSFSKNDNHAWEILIEPSFYSSKHESFNPWQEYFTSIDNPEEMRMKLMPYKEMNEYALNLGIIYRWFLKENASFYTYLNVGPMYIDTETERLKKGFAFSDILALGYNHKINDFSLDIKTYFRHASNANFQWPNYGLNSFGFEVGLYYELPN
jgi:Lipid A 3-O-deacylase (PagL)